MPPVRGICEALERDYLRTAPTDPRQIRPAHVVDRALRHVLEKAESFEPAARYRYLNSQLRSLRQDLAVQDIAGTPALLVYAVHARESLRAGDAGEFTACQTSLLSVYDRMQQPPSARISAAQGVPERRRRSAGNEACAIALGEAERKTSCNGAAREHGESRANGDEDPPALRVLTTHLSWGAANEADAAEHPETERRRRCNGAVEVEAAGAGLRKHRDCSATDDEDPAALQVTRHRSWGAANEADAAEHPETERRRRCNEAVEVEATDTGARTHRDCSATDDVHPAVVGVSDPRSWGAANAAGAAENEREPECRTWHAADEARVAATGADEHRNCGATATPDSAVGSEDRSWVAATEERTAENEREPERRTWHAADEARVAATGADEHRNCGATATPDSAVAGGSEDRSWVAANEERTAGNGTGVDASCRGPDAAGDVVLRGVGASSEVDAAAKALGLADNLACLRALHTAQRAVFRCLTHGYAELHAGEDIRQMLTCPPHGTTFFRPTLQFLAAEQQGNACLMRSAVSRMPAAVRAVVEAFGTPLRERLLEGELFAAGPASLSPGILAAGVLVEDSIQGAALVSRACGLSVPPDGSFAAKTALLALRETRQKKARDQ
ncbi:Protein THP3 [Diplonema papillatum]|nr:Protein THP3 [Diplonema papillatum]